MRPAASSIEYGEVPVPGLTSICPRTSRLVAPSTSHSSHAGRHKRLTMFGQLLSVVVPGSITRTHCKEDALMHLPTPLSSPTVSMCEWLCVCVHLFSAVRVCSILINMQIQLKCQFMLDIIYKNGKNNKNKPRDERAQPIGMYVHAPYSAVHFNICGLISHIFNCVFKVQQSFLSL